MKHVDNQCVGMRKTLSDPLGGASALGAVEPNGRDVVGRTWGRMLSSPPIRRRPYPERKVSGCIVPSVLGRPF
jgi:hypothetical protein